MEETKARPGRPLKFKTKKALQAAVDGYLARCAETEEPLSVTGLALALDTTRDVIMDYQRRDEGEPDGFSEIIKKAKLRIENAYELRLIARGNGGDVFALKQFGWSDRQEIAAACDMSLQITVDYGDGDGTGE